MGQPRDITDDLASRLEPIFARYAQIAAVYLFGSVVRGRSGPESDLDLGLVLRRGVPTSPPPGWIAELAYEVGKVVDQELVDLVLLEVQGPIFCHRVLTDGHRIYEGDRERRIDFESETMIRAFDFRPTFELATRGKRRGLRRWLKDCYDLG